MMMITEDTKQRKKNWLNVLCNGNYANFQLQHVHEKKETNERGEKSANEMWKDSRKNKKKKKKNYNK